MTIKTYADAKKLLAQRKLAKGIKKAALTRQLRKRANEWCDAFGGWNAVKNCRGCRVEAALDN